MTEISNINDKLWNLAEQRTIVIRPLAEQRRCSKVAILKAAQDLKLSVGYVYQLIKKYRSSHGLLTSLVPKKSDGGKGKSRLSKPQKILR